MPIQVTCSTCNTTLSAPDNTAGKKVRCPKCQNELLVPAAAGGEFAASSAMEMPPPAASAPPPMPRSRRDDDDDYDDEEERRPRRKSGGIPSDSPNKMVVGILAILLGGFGIHKFMLGYTTSGIIMLVVTIATCGFGGMVMGVIGIIEGILYLTKSDEEFYETYVVNKKEWF